MTSVTSHATGMQLNPPHSFILNRNNVADARHEKRIATCPGRVSVQQE
jgi:hypothetical protein